MEFPTHPRIPHTNTHTHTHTLSCIFSLELSGVHPNIRSPPTRVHLSRTGLPGQALGHMDTNLPPACVCVCVCVCLRMLIVMYLNHEVAFLDTLWCRSLLSLTDA